MDYEKAYKHALDLAKQVHDTTISKQQKENIEIIFPELAESERIRKWLINLLGKMQYHHCDDEMEMGNKALAWLEKQGEQKSVNWNELTWEDINDLETIMNEVHSDFRNGIGQKSFGLEVLERFLYNKDYEHLDIKSPKFKDGDEIRSIDGQYEDTVLEVLSDGSYRLKNLGLLSIPENEWELVNAPVNGYELIDKKEQEGFLTAKNTQKVLSQQLEKQGEQKSYGQREECLDCQFNYAGECKGSCAMKRSEIDKDKAEMDYCFTKMMNGEKISSTWSEEDEIRLNRICKTLWKNRKGDTDEIYQQEQDIDFLKSFKERYTWKPSKEQMTALSEASGIVGTLTPRGTKLQSLYNDLKKL